MGASYELILIDDRSGQHAAITAGLAQARGHWTVVMDCDLQDPPEEIPRLYAKAQKGYDMVLAERRVRKQSLVRRFLANTYFHLANTILKTNMHTNYTNLSIISPKSSRCLSEFA